ncbi:hypothetical protein ADL22_18015 [Streptomyces sp. NRRL F-4489]|uniref:hypothetical protein n=1 Tax=Streptomyces sp. NRRL F-4489 TaxID=1609095 RepID=UPI0007467B99|nr:hypothetical protein [Streptomyces sp. NRRL F-4489]KUL38537.1 hypothetical protein ADL22_18015 [Streptomyces sp. NRRL F-4489]
MSRLRRALAAAAGPLALALPLTLGAAAAPAHAATGGFSYTYESPGGPRTGYLIDPPSGVCLTLPEVAREYETPPAHSPRNDTGSPATVYTGPDCSGASYRLRPGGRASERLKLRSVVFF